MPESTPGILGGSPRSYDSDAVESVQISGVPTAGQVPVAIDAHTATWGAAGGLPGGGTVGQEIVNTGAGAGTWAGDVTWQAPAYANGWADHGAGSAPGGYRKSADGWVTLHGLIGGGAGAGETAFTLPAGYRPAAIEGFFSNGVATSEVLIHPDGTVTVFTAGGANVWLSTIAFWAGR